MAHRRSALHQRPLGRPTSCWATPVGRPRREGSRRWPARWCPGRWPSTGAITSGRATSWRRLAPGATRSATGVSTACSTGHSPSSRPGRGATTTPGARSRPASSCWPTPATRSWPPASRRWACGPRPTDRPRPPPAGASGPRRWAEQVAQALSPRSRTWLPPPRLATLLRRRGAAALRTGRADWPASGDRPELEAWHVGGPPPGGYRVPASGRLLRLRLAEAALPCALRRCAGAALAGACGHPRRTWCPAHSSDVGAWHACAGCRCPTSTSAAADGPVATPGARLRRTAGFEAAGLTPPRARGVLALVAECPPTARSRALFMQPEDRQRARVAPAAQAGGGHPRRGRGHRPPHWTTGRSSPRAEPRSGPCRPAR